MTKLFIELGARIDAEDKVKNNRMSKSPILLIPVIFSVDKRISAQRLISHPSQELST